MHQTRMKILHPMYLDPENTYPETERNRKRNLEGIDNSSSKNDQESTFNQRTRYAGLFPEPEIDPYGDAEDDIANYFTEKFRELYLKHTPEIIVKLPPPGGKLDYTTKRNIRHGKRLFKTIKWPSINGKWSQEAMKKLRLIRKSSKLVF